MHRISLKESEFTAFQSIILQEAGIELNSTKINLVQNRLLKRISHYKLSSYEDYIKLVRANKKERGEMVNLLTTNETYFFRESEHFEFLESVIMKNHIKSKSFRVWSAAASVGAEAYSCAMLLSSLMLMERWEVVGTDINSEVIKKAKVGLYPEAWIDKVPEAYKKKYCLKGKGENTGKFLIDRVIVPNMRFEVGNLLEENTGLGKFDLIFLRNVLIYFNDEVKQRVLDNTIKNLLPGGYLFISHTENLNMLNISQLKQVKTAIYQKIA